jgi:hypothetical protein
VHDKSGVHTLRTYKWRNGDADPAGIDIIPSLLCYSGAVSLLNIPCATSICILTKVICTFGCGWPESNCDDSEVRSQRKTIVIVHNVFSIKPRARFRPSIVPLPHVYRKPRLLNDHLLHRSACPISISFSCSSTLFGTCLAISV